MHAIVVADEFVFVASGLAVRPGGARIFCNRVVVGCKGATLSVCSQVLAGIKTEGRGMAEAADASSAISGTMRLSCVFQDEKFQLIRDRKDCVHIRGTSIQMNRNDCSRSRGSGALDLRGIEIGSGWIDIHEHRPCAAVRDCLGGGEKGVGTGD